jgi:hypothetical protein
MCGRVACCGSHGGDNGEVVAAGQPLRRAFPKAFATLFLGIFRTLLQELFPRLLQDLSEAIRGGLPDQNQLFSSALMRLLNSSNEVSPLIFSPLIKNVGVESTFNTSLAYFWSAAILSSSA